MSMPAVELVSAESLGRMSNMRVFDLRSPAEYNEDHVVGAQNLPLLDNVQRALVGTIYKQESQEEAFECGLQIVKENLPAMLKVLFGDACPEEQDWRPHVARLSENFGQKIKQAIPHEGTSFAEGGGLLLYCWRGGMRSRSVALLLSALGMKNIFVLDKGYKGYRKWVRKRLENIPANLPLVVLRGMTGVGKTCILNNLEKHMPGSTIDLEGLAEHRSSILGAVGLTPRTQKHFESLLVDRLNQLGPPPWFIEAESRKVGDIILPEPLYLSLSRATQIVLEAPLAYRIEHLGGEYTSSTSWQIDVAKQLPFLEQRLGKKWHGVLSAWLEEGKWQNVVEVLLTHYYDKRYGQTTKSPKPIATLDVMQHDVLEQLLDLREKMLSGRQNYNPLEQN
jgi:tRNA 2-selenouridine synthase